MLTDPRVHALRLGEYNVPKRLRHLHLESLDDSDERLICAAWVAELRDHYVTDKRPLDEYPADWSQIGRGLLLIGPPGTGKTTLATATLLDVYHNQRLPVFWTAFADYVALNLERMSLEDRREPEATDRWYSIQSLIKDVHQAPVLLLDDVGKEHRTKTGYAEGLLDALLRDRHRESRPTIMTSNLHPSKWGATYNASMGSFINEAFTHIELVRKDRRG